jgi:phospholipid transport system substrate-binding protein
MIPRPLLLLVPLLLAFRAGAASPTAEAEARLHTVIDSVVSIAERASTTKGLAEKLRPILVKYISFDAMTRRAIGPGWRQFSKEQQAEATSLFTSLIIRTYAGKYTPGEHPETTFKAATMPAPGRVEIPTTLAYKGSRYTVLYRMEQAEGWSITDVVAEGVSLVANYRAQLDPEFKKGGAPGVIAALQRSVSATK